MATSKTNVTSISPQNSLVVVIFLATIAPSATSPLITQRKSCYSLLLLVFTFCFINFRFYGAQIASVFEYLHSKDIAYRDLKPENIMIGNDGYLKLIDYGFAKIVTKRTYTICGTPEYIAPEILLNKGHSKPVDWWTFGILIYEMHAGHAPFMDDDVMNIYKKIINTKPRYPEGFDSKLKSLVKHLLRRDLSKRYGNLVGGVADITNHRFFAKVIKPEMLAKTLPVPYSPPSKAPPAGESDFLA